MGFLARLSKLTWEVARISVDMGGRSGSILTDRLPAHFIVHTELGSRSLGAVNAILNKAMTGALPWR